MAPNNPIQFAVVREDAAVELALLPEARADTTPVALVVASGGCTALALSAERPDVQLTALDMNPAQLELVSRKFAAVRGHPPGPAREAVFGVGVDDPGTLNGCGNFESLFRSLRAVLDEFVLPADVRRRLLLAPSGDVEAERLPTALAAHRYWPVAFQGFFSDGFLEAMFGPDATQHAPRGSYPAYFQNVIEAGLHRGDRARNWFLHHVLLGAWERGVVPRFLELPAGPMPTFVEAPMAGAPSFEAFDLVSLSNLFDWMDDAGVQRITARLEAECRPGAVVVIRQLNNRRPVEALLPGFDCQHDTAAALLQRDRSLFYERLLVGVKR